MKRIYITGMSGTGKSSVLEKLKQKGFSVIDTDYDNWQEQINLTGKAEWLLNEDRLNSLLTEPSTSPLFVSGCCANQGKFYPSFDYIILLSAPLDVMLKRIEQRTSNPYGKNERERKEIIDNYKNIQPLLKSSSDIEIDTEKKNISEIVEILIELVKQ